MLRFIYLCGEPLATFNLMLGLGLLSIVAGTLAQIRLRSLKGAAETGLLAAIPVSAGIGVVLAAVADYLFRGLRHGWHWPEEIGFVYFGWLAGCIAAFGLHSAITGIRWKFLLDFFLPLFALAQSFGRIGCFLGGCCFGRPAEWFGLVYPPGSIPDAVYGQTPLFPVQLLEALYLAVVFIILWRRVPFRFRGGAYLLLAAIGRFGCEYLRGDFRGSIGTVEVFSPAQCLGFGCALLGAFLLWRGGRRNAEDAVYRDRRDLTPPRER